MERKRESRLDRAVRQLERIACAMVRTSASSDREGEGEREDGERQREKRAYACVCRALCTCIAGQRWRTSRDQQKAALSSTTSVRMSAVIDYARRRNAMRFINFLCGPPPRRERLMRK